MCASLMFVGRGLSLRCLRCSEARSVVQNQSDLTPSGSVAGMATTFTAVKGDLRALNRKCGQPPGAYEGDSF